MASKTKKTKYQVMYQLGGRGSVHRKLSAAARAAARASNRCARDGDHQAVGIVAIDYPADGTDPWGIYRPLTEAELAEVEGSY